MKNFIRTLLFGQQFVDLCANLFEVGDAERNAERFGLYLIRQGDHIATQSDKRTYRAELAERTYRGDRIRRRFGNLWQAKPWAWMARERTNNVLTLKAATRGRAVSDSPR